MVDSEATPGLSLNRDGDRSIEVEVDPFTVERDVTGRNGSTSSRRLLDFRASSLSSPLLADSDSDAAGTGHHGSSFRRQGADRSDSAASLRGHRSRSSRRLGSRTRSSSLPPYNGRHRYADDDDDGGFVVQAFHKLNPAALGSLDNNHVSGVFLLFYFICIYFIQAVAQIFVLIYSIVTTYVEKEATTLVERAWLICLDTWLIVLLLVSIGAEIVSLRSAYFKNPLLVADLVIAILSIVGLLLYALEFSFSEDELEALRALHIVRDTFRFLRIPLFIANFVNVYRRRKMSLVLV